MKKIASISTVVLLYLIFHLFGYERFSSFFDENKAGDIHENRVLNRSRYEEGNSALSRAANISHVLISKIESKKKIDTDDSRLYSSEVIEWEKNHFGYFHTTFKKSDYDSYDVETLELMASQHDLKALNMLSSKYLEAGRVDMAIDANQRAAVLGSTWALSLLGTLEPVTAGQDDVHSRVMNQLSYMQAALIRGDKRAIDNTVRTLKYYKGVISDDNVKEIKITGRHIYNNLETERAKMGLNPFDNSVPWYVDKRRTQLNRETIKKYGVESPLFSIDSKQ